MSRTHELTTTDYLKIAEDYAAHYCFSPINFDQQPLPKYVVIVFKVFVNSEAIATGFIRAEQSNLFIVMKGQRYKVFTKKLPQVTDSEPFYSFELINVEPKIEFATAYLSEQSIDGLIRIRLDNQNGYILRDGCNILADSETPVTIDDKDYLVIRLSSDDDQCVFDLIDITYPGDDSDDY